MSGIARDVVLFCLLSVPLAPADCAAAVPGQSGPLDEVVVEATRAKLNEMRKEMVQLENRFYERYNELNTNNDFDTHCRLEASLGTLLKHRDCRAVYQDRALEDEGSEYVRSVQQNPPAANPSPPAQMTSEARYAEYQKNLMDVTRKDPELIRLLIERFKLGKRYEAASRKVFGQAPPSR